MEDAEEFINDLIQNQVLISELEPSVTGEELLKKLIDQIANLSQTEELVKHLKEIQSYLQSIDELPIGRPIEKYKHIYDSLENFKLPIDKKYLFQSDLYISCDKATLSEDTVNSVIEGISVLNRLTTYYENWYLKKFKEEFYKRYENKEMPLAEALDVETGIGFADKGNLSSDINKLIDDIIINRHVEINQTVSISPIDSFLQKKYEDFISDPGKTEIRLTEEELDQFPLNWNDVPNTISCLIEVVSHDNVSPVILMDSVGGSSAANLLGRFCHLDQEIEKLVKKITKKEQELDSGKILAEIVHLPESRTGNILYRPNIRDYEIAYLANSSVNHEHTIHLNDLMVSVINGKKITLRSKSLNKEIIPRLTTAHNFSFNALPVYQFLCNLQTQNIRGGLSFNWSPTLRNREYLPRIRYKNIILSPAIWNISSTDVKNIPKINHEDFISKVEELRLLKKIPKKVLWSLGDNKLLIDFDHTLSVQLLFDNTKNRGFQLEEFLYDSDNFLVKRNDENFTNQFILCLYKSDLKKD